VSLGSGVFYGLDKRLNCWGSTKWHLWKVPRLRLHKL
jgi:hypothetical protein